MMHRTRGLICLGIVAGISGPAIRAQAQPRVAQTRAALRNENDDELGRAQIAAATSNAFAALRNDLLQRQITPTLTIADYLKQIDGRDAFNKSLHQAEQIGGPRWIDDQTCQIQLEISGARIVQALTDIASANPERAPIPAAEIDQRLATWKDRTFAATGSSIRADRVAELRPFGAEAWQGVDDASRVNAINAARENAVARVLDELRPVQLDSQSTFGQVMEKSPQVKKDIHDWLGERPVTAVNFTDDLQVRYTIALSRRQLFDAFIQSAKHANVSLPPADELAKVLDRFHQEIANTTGVAPAQASRIMARHVDPIQELLPPQAPEWIFQQIDAEAAVNPGQSPLRTKREAEDRATDSIRAKLLAMKLNDNLTIREAGEKSPAIREAVSRAVARVRLYKVDYAADGSVTVKMMLDPREFWFDITRQ